VAAGGSVATGASVEAGASVAAGAWVSAPPPQADSTMLNITTSAIKWNTFIFDFIISLSFGLYSNGLSVPF
jgi:hypothetical protein